MVDRIGTEPDTLTQGETDSAQGGTRLGNNSYSVHEFTNQARDMIKLNSPLELN